MTARGRCRFKFSNSATVNALCILCVLRVLCVVAMWSLTTEFITFSEFCKKIRNQKSVNKRTSYRAGARWLGLLLTRTEQTHQDTKISHRVVRITCSVTATASRGAEAAPRRHWATGAAKRLLKAFLPADKDWPSGLGTVCHYIGNVSQVSCTRIQQ